MHGFRDYRGYTQISSKTNRVGSGVQSKNSIYQVFKSIKRFESHFTEQSIIVQYYYQLCWDYLLIMGRMDEEQAVF